MTQIATRKTKLGNLLKGEFKPEHGYERDTLTINVSSTSEIGLVVNNDGDGTYSAVAAADTTITVTPTVANSADYSVSITANGVARTFTYTSDVDATATEIVNGLIALIEADAGIVAAGVTVANSSDTLAVSGADAVQALTSNLTVVNGLADIAILIDDEVYKLDLSAGAADHDLAVLRGGPGGSGGAIVVREQLKFSGAMTDAQIDAVVSALNARGIKVGTQV